MKTTLKTKLAIGTLALTFGVASLMPQASYAMRVDALDDTWGQPAKVQKTDNGSELRYFALEGKMPGLYDDDQYRVFEVQKDGKVIDKGFAKKSYGK